MTDEQKLITDATRHVSSIMHDGEIRLNIVPLSNRYSALISDSGEAIGLARTSSIKGDLGEYFLIGDHISIYDKGKDLSCIINGVEIGKTYYRLRVIVMNAEGDKYPVITVRVNQICSHTPRFSLHYASVAISCAGG